MRLKTKLKIGEFSHLMQVTVKTLRHYEQKGLLIPEEVDPWTGYRYYSISQMTKLNSIRQLQRLGFSLEEIKDLFEDESHVPSIEQLTAQIAETDKKADELIVYLMATFRTNLTSPIQAMRNAAETLYLKTKPY